MSEHTPAGRVVTTAGSATRSAAAAGQHRERVNVELGLRALIGEVVREELAKLCPPIDDVYLSPVTAAEIAGVAVVTVRRWIREGRIVSHQAGRAVRVKRSDLEKFLQLGKRTDAGLTPEQMAARDFGQE